jgi:hypothetical protein
MLLEVGVDVRSDDRGARLVGCGLAEVKSPPGINYIDAMCDAQDAKDQACRD